MSCSASASWCVGASPTAPIPTSPAWTSVLAASCAAASISRCSSQPPLRVLAVHLKTGCFDERLSTSRRRACAELREQMPPLLDWIGARRAEGVAFAILGDFNRHMDGRDQFWSALRQAAPLTRATEGRASPCWGGEAFIDHIVLGNAARDWLLPDTLRVLTYRETGAEWKQRLSDHCPVSVRLRLPD